MRWLAIVVIVVGLLVGSTARVPAQGFTEVGSIVWIDGTIDEPNPSVEAIVYAGNAGSTDRYLSQVDCRLFVVERDLPETTVTAYCQVGRKAKGGKAYLNVTARDADREYAGGCRTAIHKLRSGTVLSCTFNEQPASS